MTCFAGQWLLESHRIERPNTVTILYALWIWCHRILILIGRAILWREKNQTRRRNTTSRTLAHTAGTGFTRARYFSRTVSAFCVPLVLRKACTNLPKIVKGSALGEFQHLCVELLAMLAIGVQLDAIFPRFSHCSVAVNAAVMIKGKPVPCSGRRRLEPNSLRDSM